MHEQNYHNPVLLKETLEELVSDTNGLYIDATFGGGGHSRALLEKLTKKSTLIALDQDKDALEKKIEDPRFSLFHQNFRYVENLLKAYNIKEISGILADLGVSSYQIDTPKRGFSTRFNYDLDMRMNQSTEKTAHQIINNYSENELSNLFLNYGELKEAKFISKEIIKTREKKEIKNTFDLIAIFEKKIPPQKRAKYFAKLFQAIRIEVNDELEALKEFLTQCPSILKPKGRLVIISYHSLEDRLVKRFFKTGNFEGIVKKDFYGNKILPLKTIYSKAIKASEKEIKQNPRARSARLRVAEKL